MYVILGKDIFMTNTDKNEKEEQFAEQKSNLMDDTIKKCNMLYKMANRPCNETCMCWLWECGYGWFDTLAEVSNKLEALNLIVYPKYKVRIQAEQVKEKFATLRFYYSIVADPPWYIRWFEAFMQFVMVDLLSKIKYNVKSITVKDGYYTYDEQTFLTKEDFETEKNRFKNASDVEFDDSNGQYIKRTKCWHVPKFNMIATKHRIFYWFYKRRYAFKNWLRYALNWNESDKQSIIKTWLDDMASKIIRDAEHECEHHCETCGRYIGTDYSPTCTTKGWIKMICKECADKRDAEYIMNGETWRNGKKVSKPKKTKSSKSAKTAKKD